MDSKPGDYRVINDLSEYYINTIAQSLDLIDELGYTILGSPDKIFHINSEIHKIFKKIYPKLKKNNLDKEIKFQWKIEKALQKLSPIKKEKKLDSQSGDIYVSTSRTPDFLKYKLMVEKREIHIYYCLELIGMIAKETKTERRLR